MKIERVNGKRGITIELTKNELSNFENHKRITKKISDIERIEIVKGVFNFIIYAENKFGYSLYVSVDGINRTVENDKYVITIRGVENENRSNIKKELWNKV